MRSDELDLSGEDDLDPDEIDWEDDYSQFTF